jgi:glycosyltransferase involved in cell wall biosynthesis
MKILFVCYELPSPSDAGSFRVLYSVKYLYEKCGHDITLIAFRLPQKGYPDLSDYCQIETIDIPCRPGFGSAKAIFYALKSLLSLFSPGPYFRMSSYSPKLDRRIKALIDNNDVDLMAVDHTSMLCYASGSRVPTVLLEAFATSEIALMEYKRERNWCKKIIRLLYYYQTKGYANVYRDLVNVSIAVSNHQRDMVKSHCPNLDIEVIPLGIDTDYFRAVETEQKVPSLIITGTMGGNRNKTTTLYFYNDVYPLIKASVPQVKLYIVGANPGKDILRLARDESVVVTGYVKDLRPYLSRAWVVVAPLQEGFGVKVRVLQAMAVGKPVVATYHVISGIDASSGENIIIADEPSEFAERVIELLNDKQLRAKIGDNARKLIENEYSCEKTTAKLNAIFQKVVNEK